MRGHAASLTAQTPTRQACRAAELARACGVPLRAAARACARACGVAAAAVPLCAGSSVRPPLVRMRPPLPATRYSSASRSAALRNRSTGLRCQGRGRRQTPARTMQALQYSKSSLYSTCPSRTPRLQLLNRLQRECTRARARGVRLSGMEPVWISRSSSAAAEGPSHCCCIRNRCWIGQWNGCHCKPALARA